MTTQNPEPEPTDIDAIRTDIEQTRAELAATVEQVVDKLDVKAQVGHKTDAVKQAVADKAAQAKAAVPAPVQSALGTVGEKAGPPAHRAGEVVAPHRGKIVAGAVAGLVVLFVVRRRRRSG